MKGFLESNATRYVLAYLAYQVLVALAPMLSKHEIDPWRLAEAFVGAALLLLVNSLRKDIRTGVPMLDRKNEQ